MSERLRDVLAAHEADVTSYDAGDLHGCVCGWRVPADVPRDPVLNMPLDWPPYYAHLETVVLAWLDDRLADEEIVEDVRAMLQRVFQ